MSVSGKRVGGDKRWERHRSTGWKRVASLLSPPRDRWNPDR